MLGLSLGLAAGACFAAGSVLARVGQRHRHSDDGLLMSVAVNVLVLAVVALGADAPSWNPAGVAALIVGGILGSVLGRTASLRSVRLIGATRSSAFMTASPVAAAVAGWLLLDETVTLLDGGGGALVIGGLLALTLGRSQPDSHDQPVGLRGYLIAAAAPLSFGLGFVVKKWGLGHYPSAVHGALIGSAAALGVVIAIDSLRGRLSTRLHENFVQVPWWFVGAGVAMSGALLAQFAAFDHLPAWLVGAMQGTQALWALAFGWLFLRADEHIDRRVALSVALVAGGVALIALGR